MAQEYRIEVEFPGGLDVEYERDLEKVAHKPCDGGGMLLATGTRDLSWTFRTKQRALDAFNRLSAQKRLSVVRLERRQE